MITLLFNKSKLSHPRVQKLIAELTAEKKLYVRVPGESKAGICPYCAQFIFMVHDLSGTVVPIPVVGTHVNCVCNDIPLPIFKLGTVDTIKEETNSLYVYKTRRAKKGEVKQYEWLRYQSQKTKKQILGIKKAGYLGQVPVEKLYNQHTDRIKTNSAIAKSLRKK